MKSCSLRFISVLAFLFCAPIEAHDPGFHVATAHAQEWLKTGEGNDCATQAVKRVLKTADVSMESRKGLNSHSGLQALANLAKNDEAPAMTHILRLWAGDKVPAGLQHLLRCAVCNQFVNHLLRALKQREIKPVEAKASNRLSLAKATSLIGKLERKLFYQLTAELCDVNGDSFLDGVRLDNDGDALFDTYHLDLDRDGFVDAILEWDGKTWKRAKRTQ